MYASSGAHGISAEPFHRYKELNDREKRYLEFMDSDSALAAKLIQLEYINEAREQHGAQPLELDILASRVANRMSREACEGGYSGHWNTRGEKPYHRYAFAGGVDHVAENAASIYSTEKLESSWSDVQDYMEELFDTFMAEKPPHDQHRENCIRREHNYIGIGFHITKNDFRYYEEYIDRYIDFIHVDSEVRRNEYFRISFKPMLRRHHVYAIVAYYEPFPTPMTPAQIERGGSYNDYTPHRVLELWPWELGTYQKDGIHDIPMKFDKRGLYYVHIYLDDEPFEGNYANTEGKIQASGIVVKVE